MCQWFCKTLMLIWKCFSNVFPKFFVYCLMYVLHSNYAQDWNTLVLILCLFSNSLTEILFSLIVICDHKIWRATSVTSWWQAGVQTQKEHPCWQTIFSNQTESFTGQDPPLRFGGLTEQSVEIKLFAPLLSSILMIYWKQQFMLNILNT